MPEGTAVEYVQPSKKGKERAGETPQPTDIAARMVALQRKQAQMTRPKDRSDRPQTSSATSKPIAHSQSPRRMLAHPASQPNIIVSQPSPLAESGPDEHDFDRRLRISHTPPRHIHKKAEHTSPRGQGKLFNPHADLVRKPVMTAEPDAMSEDESAGLARSNTPSSLPRFHGRAQPSRPGGDAHRLFDPRKDNPYQPALLIRAHAAANGSPPSNSRIAPTPKSSGDWVSASSTSSASYAHSSVSSSFTLNSTTTDSSASSAIFSNEQRSEDSTASTGKLSAQLKQLYRRVVTLESQLSKTPDSDMQDDGEANSQRIGVLLKTQQSNGRIKREIKGGNDEADKERYSKLVTQHKQLSEVVYELLTLTMAPSVPISLRNIPKKYNLVGRMWTNAFYLLLENLRRTATQCPADAEENVALEHLVSFIYYSYTFYSGLLDEPNLSQFNSSWVESLGDLARYRMAVAALIENRNARILPGTLTMSAISRAALTANPLLPNPGTPDVSALSDKNASPTPADTPMRVARIDDSPPVSDAQQQPLPGMAASVGIVAARQMELLPEKEHWRQISREWFTKGLAFAPGSGKLHHHLGMLSRDTDGGEKEELRAVYHFVKSMTAVHPFTTSREAVLPLWSPAAQARRQAPDAGITELFLLLQGMIFTNIQLDDFKSVLARFEEKLVLEGRDVEEPHWIMMALININSVLEYGRSNAALRRVSGVQSNGAVSPLLTNGNGKVKLMTARKPELDDKGMDVDDDNDIEAEVNGVNGARTLATPFSPVISGVNTATSSASSELPLQLKYALQLTFTMLTHTLKNPIRQPSALSRSWLNPYVTAILTFLATVLKDKSAERVLARAVPWEALAEFLTKTMPRRIMQHELSQEAVLPSTGCQPLPEDWCMRGLGWGGKKIYERGFWDRDTKGEDKNFETEILDRKDAGDAVMDGIIEDEDDSDERAKDSVTTRSNMQGRWVRIARCAVKLGRTVNGFVFTPPMTRDGRGEWRVEGALADKVAKWREEDRREKAEEERRLRGTRWGDDDMDVDEDEIITEDEMSEEEDDASEEVRALKDRLKYLRNLLVSSKHAVPSRQHARSVTSRDKSAARLRMVPGYTVLVVDTNILLSSLSVVASLVESLQWTVIVPLPVIMELDGLASEQSVLGEAAAAATLYIVSHLRSHAASLKIQTSRGNYLANLNVRTEQVDLRDNQSSWERNMDDLILRAAMWQTTHWVDRSVFLQSANVNRDITGACKVALLTFDRMLRLKARSRDVDAASEHDLAALLAGKA